MTKMTYVKALEVVLNGGEMTQEVREKLEALKAQQEKRNNNSGEHKPTTNQKENANYREAILKYMTKGVRYTITDLMHCVPEIAIAELTNQRVSAIVRQLRLNGDVIRIDEKRKAYFELAD